MVSLMRGSNRGQDTLDYTQGTRRKVQFCGAPVESTGTPEEGVLVKEVVVVVV
jgi:hypothetical protein